MAEKNTPCGCAPESTIGISDGDSIGYWQCRECGHEWERDGYFAELARRNIDAMRERDCKLSETKRG